MAGMTKLDRVCAALDHKPTDRVPLYDLLLNDDCIEYFAGTYPPFGPEGARLQAVAVNRMLDMARGLGIPPREPAAHFTDDPVLLEWSRYGNLTYREHAIESYAQAAEWAKQQVLGLRNWRENTDLQQADENTRAHFAQLHSWLGDDPVVACLRQSDTGLDLIRGTTGIEFFSYLCADEPEVVAEFLELYTQRETEIIHAVADPKLSPWALTYGDIAMKGALLHSPDWLRQEFLPRIKRVNDAYHEHGVRCLFHSDGDLMEIMPELIATGIDGINPIETVAGMDVGEVYRLYGDRIFMTGGIDMSQLLSNGTPDRVRDVCRQAVRAAPTGYLMGSTTEIDNSARLENVLAMVEVSWGAPPQGEHPDSLERVHRRHAQRRQQAEPRRVSVDNRRLTAGAGPVP